MTNVRSHRSFACLVALVTAVALAVAAPISSAQTSQGGYTPPGSNVQAEIQDSPSTPAGDPSASTAATTTRSGSRASGTLPFTGLDVGFIGLAGAGLVLGGLGLRRMTLRGSQAQQRNAA
jgi:hypothetical protein